METQFIGEQEQIIAALVYGIIFLVLITIVLMLFFHFSRKKITEKEIEKIALQLDHQQRILQTTISVQEEERKRIAQDIHDAISSKLNVVSLTTHMLLGDASINKEQQASLQHILDVTTNTIESSRKLAHDLIPPILDKFGLKVALEELFEDFTKSTRLLIIYDIEELSFLTKSNELHIFRIIQELINNSVKHAQSSIVNINLTHENDQGFTLCYQDNGTGFTTTKLSKKSGIGLQNIKSRTAILNCTISIESTLNEGSKFTISSITHE